MDPEIISIGEPLLEFSAKYSGALLDNQDFELGYGGDTSNFVIAASRAGGSAGYISRIGNDEFGRIFLELWKKENVDTRYISQEKNGFTGVYFISRSDRGHSFTYYRKGSAASHLSVNDIPQEYIANSKVLHVSGISQAISNSACDAVFHAIGVAREAGRTICYDPNIRPKLWSLARARAIVWETIRMSDFILPSMEDAELLTGVSDPYTIIEKLMKFEPRVVVLKLGENGALVAADDVINRIEPYPVEVVDTTGAGDTFDGYFVANYLRGHSVIKSAEIANVAAALTTTGHGAVNPIPRLETVDLLIRQISGGE